MSSGLVFLTASEAIGGAAAVYLASNYVMPMLLSDGDSLCISNAGLVVSAASGNNKYLVWIKMLVDLAAFMLGSAAGRYVEQRFLR